MRASAPNTQTSIQSERVGSKTLVGLLHSRLGAWNRFLDSEVEAWIVLPRKRSTRLLVSVFTLRVRIDYLR